MPTIVPLLAAMTVATSYYPVRLDDPKAVYLDPPQDDATAAIQRAIDKVQETTGQGIVFIPSGR